MEQNNNKCCLIYNFSQHYRKAIFKEMDQKLGFDFYFGDHLDWAPDVKSFDLSELKGFKAEVKNINIYKFIWQTGTIGLAFKDYRHYILYGDPKYLSSWIIMIVCRLLGKKTYLWMHGFKQKLNWKEKLMTYPFIALADKLLLYGDYSRNLMIENGISEQKLVCIYNSLDYNLQLKIRNQLVQTNIYTAYFNNKFPVLIYIGRIQKSKRIHLVFDAMVLLKKRGINCNFIVIGEDKEDVNLSKNITDSIIDNVWLYGKCYDEDKIGELIFNANVCVSPGNVGLTAIHSLTYGTPVVTHSNFQNQGPEFEAIQKGVTGDFFIENDDEDLSRKIENWIKLNEEERESVRRASYKIIDKKYNSNHQIQVLKRVLKITELEK